MTPEELQELIEEKAQMTYEVAFLNVQIRPLRMRAEACQERIWEIEALMETIT